MDLGRLNVFLILIFLFNSALAQNDSIVYIYDTIIEEETVEEYVFGLPQEFGTIDFSAGYMHLTSLGNWNGSIIPYQYSIDFTYSRNNHIFLLGFSVQEHSEYYEEKHFSLSEREEQYYIPSIWYTQRIGNQIDTIRPLFRRNVIDTTWNIETFRHDFTSYLFPFGYGYTLIQGYANLSVIGELGLSYHKKNGIEIFDTRFYKFSPFSTQKLKISYFFSSHFIGNAGFSNFFLIFFYEDKIQYINTLSVDVSISFIFFDKKKRVF